MFKFRVNRKKWARGGKNGIEHGNYLLNNRGTMCCLGFLAKACGYESKTIKGKSMPEQVVYSVKSDLFPTGLVKDVKPLDLYDMPKRDTRQCGRIASCNDKEAITDEVREARLKKLFATINIEVEFFG